MTEQVIVTDSSTTVAQVTVSDSTTEITTVTVTDVASLNDWQLDRLRSVAIGAEVDTTSLVKLAEWVQAYDVTSAGDTELASGQIPMPYFDPPGGRILWYVEGPMKAAFASTIIVKVKGVTPSGTVSTIATFTSTAVAGGAGTSFWKADVCMTALTRSTQRLTCTFEYIGPSGAKVRETFWATGSYGFTQDTDVRLDLSCGAGTLSATTDAAIFVECYHKGRRSGTW